MRLRITNESTRTFDVSRFGFESAGALGFVTNTQGLPLAPARYIGFEEPEPACSVRVCPNREALMKLQPDSSFAAYVGIDWADKKHDFCLQASGSSRREAGVVMHTPEAIVEWASSLRSRFQGPIAVCLEISKGPLINALQRYDFFVIFPLNPAMLAKYREAFTPSGAKDDPSDAALALELLMSHRDKLKVLKVQSPAMRMLARLVEDRRMLVGDKTRITNRLGKTLKEYFPQALHWFERRDTMVFCDFLSRWPTLKHAKRARSSTLQSFFRDHNVRFSSVIDERIQSIRDATTLTDDDAVIRPCQLLVQVLVAQLRTTLDAIKRLDDEITAVSETLPDYKLFAALPGAGPILGPRLLVAFGEERERYSSAAEVQQYSGVAPVVERSGTKCWTHWRLACPTFLRQTFIEWAGATIPRSFWAAAYYRQQLAKGCSHRVAVRALAFKWIRILYRCWKDRTPYDESTYLNALHRRGSPLLKTV
jgi:transposase